MEKKVVIIGIIITLILLLVSIYISTRPKPYSPEEPETWVEDSTIDIDKATGRRMFMDSMGLQYRDTEISTVFELEGYYKGQQFTNQFVEDGEVKIRITTEMTPDDGIMEGFMTEKREDGQWIVDIFLDEDWKEQMNFTNIQWGVMYTKMRPFEFKEIDSGMYHDQIIDDAERFSDDARIRTFGILVGDVTKEHAPGRTMMSLS
ncbi:hypothetical protein KY346_03055 [Candidatus Woesearchaeota archaeon]|nr:hypothetical protein [Candidatus Woesearchaeota archaeon]